MFATKAALDEEGERGIQVLRDEATLATNQSLRFVRNSFESFGELAIRRRDKGDIKHHSGSPKRPKGSSGAQQSTHSVSGFL